MDRRPHCRGRHHLCLSLGYCRLEDKRHRRPRFQEGFHRHFPIAPAIHSRRNLGLLLPEIPQSLRLPCPAEPHLLRRCRLAGHAPYVYPRHLARHQIPHQDHRRQLPAIIFPSVFFCRPNFHMGSISSLRPLYCTYRLPNFILT